MLSLRARVDPETMAMKRYSTSLKIPELLKPHRQIAVIVRLLSIISRTLVGIVLPLSRDALGVFCNPGKWVIPLWVRVELRVMAMKGVLQIPQSSKTEASPSDCIMS